VLTPLVHRYRLTEALEELEPCLIAIEASIGASYRQRQLEKLVTPVTIAGSGQTETAFRERRPEPPISPNT
jgi:hypothetical protein